MRRSGARTVRQFHTQRNVELQRRKPGIEPALLHKLARGSDGGNIGKTGGQANPRGYAFDFHIEQNGYAWWYVDALSSALNNNFSAVVSLFQDSDNFGRTFAQVLDGLGSSRSSGAISLALKEDKSQEKTLNDNISKQEELIATQKEHLTAELNLANQILQAIPQQIQQVDEMYSAITGYKTGRG